MKRKITSLQKLTSLFMKYATGSRDIEDIADVCFAGGSTHVMKTCVIDGNKFYLKFSDENLFDGVDPSLQILIEYLAYAIYSLYAGIKIPSFELVFDKINKRVGLATSEIKGLPALSRDLRLDHKILGQKMSQGVYVDILLSNWDVVGTGSGNVFYDESTEEVTRMDPGGSLTFRARGGRKGKSFSPSAGELKTMLNPDPSGSGRVFQYSDLKIAAKEFKNVPWAAIESKINQVGVEVSDELIKRDMQDLVAQWQADVEEIREKLSHRYKAVLEHIRFMEKV